MADLDQVKHDLFRLAAFLRTERWGALGGEPTLHPRLVDILHVVADSGITPCIEVWTNGMRLRQMSSEFWTAFDILVVSVYPGKLSDDDLDWITKKCQDERRELVFKDERRSPNFRTLFEKTPTDSESTRAKFHGCFFKSFSRVVNNGYFFTCCCAPHMPELVLGKTFGHDGIAIEGLTEDLLRAYLDRTEPLDACRVCAGRDTAQPLTWHEQKDPAKWLKESAGR